ncbi:MAG: diguanylate cyclase [Planctomycetaceae bacterium]|nr:diguanylate cyclase [Planctomycetaceae bacterium]
MNIVIGCYAAVLLGFGPPTVNAALSLIIDTDLLADYWERSTRLRSLLSKLPIPVLSFQKTVAESGTGTETAEEPVEEKNDFDSVIEKLTNADVSAILADETDEISNLVPMQEIFDDDLAAVLAEQGTESWFVNEKRVETSLLKLNVVMMKSGQFSAELDKRIRSRRGSLTQADNKQFLGELKDDCRNYLESQAAITEQMKKRFDEFGELQNLAEEVDFANMEQSAQIETTLSNLDNLVLTLSPEDGGSRLLKELSNLRLARHRLRDMQEKMFITISFYEDRVDTIPQQLYIEEYFGIRGRIGLEVAINEWWKQKRNAQRQITFALLDFVKFGAANEEHGIAVCDKAIKYFGHFLQEQFDTADLIGIYEGNCFLVATLNAGPKKTITEIERVRQNCEKTVFKYGSGSMQLQLTCGITEALETQSRTDVLAALEKTLAFAKKNGRNHTFYFVPGLIDKPPEKVEAPNLGEEPKEAELV